MKNNVRSAVAALLLGAAIAQTALAAEPADRKPYFGDLHLHTSY
jgi:hypothetical protein